MKTDIQIAQEAEMKHIREVAEGAGIAEAELEFYGKYKAKLSDELWERIKDREDGKLVLVTAINPTPAGEGISREIFMPSLLPTICWQQCLIIISSRGMPWGSIHVRSCGNVAWT